MIIIVLLVKPSGLFGRVRRPEGLVRGARARRGARPRASLLVLAVACALPFTLSGFRVFQFTQVCIYAIALLGLNILTGYNGQISSATAPSTRSAPTPRRS